MLRELQAPIKQAYRDNPGKAVTPLQARLVGPVRTALDDRDKV